MDEPRAVMSSYSLLSERAQAIGPPKERGDRDFRKQTIMP